MANDTGGPRSPTRPAGPSPPAARPGPRPPQVQVPPSPAVSAATSPGGRSRDGLLSPAPAVTPAGVEAAQAPAATSPAAEVDSLPEHPGGPNDLSRGAFESLVRGWSDLGMLENERMVSEEMHVLERIDRLGVRANDVELHPATLGAPSPSSPSSPESAAASPILRSRPGGRAQWQFATGPSEGSSGTGVGGLGTDQTDRGDYRHTIRKARARRLARIRGQQRCARHCEIFLVLGYIGVFALACWSLDWTVRGQGLNKNAAKTGIETRFQMDVSPQDAPPADPRRGNGLGNWRGWRVLDCNADGLADTRANVLPADMIADPVAPGTSASSGPNATATPNRVQIPVPSKGSRTSSWSLMDVFWEDYCERWNLAPPPWRVIRRDSPPSLRLIDSHGLGFDVSENEDEQCDEEGPGGSPGGGGGRGRRERRECRRRSVRVEGPSGRQFEVFVRPLQMMERYRFATRDGGLPVLCVFLLVKVTILLRSFLVRDVQVLHDAIAQVGDIPHRRRWKFVPCDEDVVSCCQGSAFYGVLSTFTVLFSFLVWHVTLGMLANT